MNVGAPESPSAFAEVFDVALANRLSPFIDSDRRRRCHRDADPVAEPRARIWPSPEPF